MLFVIQAAAMDGAESVLDALDAILSRAEDEVHEVSIIRADLLEQSAWYTSSRRDRKKLLEEIAEASIHRAPRAQGPHLSRVEVSDQASAAEARSLAYAPLLVLLENDISDALLVKAAVLMFSQSNTQELCFGAPSKVEPPAFSMESRGGHGELKKLVTRCLEQAAERGHRPRLVVVTDSDGEWVGDVKDHATSIRAECAVKGVPGPPLNKRTAENYIPDSVWRAWAAVPDHTNARPAVEALLRLSPDQRDHVRLESPQGGPWDPMKPNAASLFQGVSPVDRGLLEQANLKGKGDSRLIFALRDHANALTPIDLQNRDHHGDLQAIVRHIEDEL